jgi:hypothetical protein
VDVEVVLEEHDDFRLGEVNIGQLFQDVSIVDRGMAMGDLDVASSLRAARTS